MKHLRILLPRLLVETSLIVLSVLLALAVNNWNIRRQEQNRAEEARAAFLSEIAANRQMLASDDMLAHHQRLQKIYAQAAKIRAPDPKALFETGLHPPNFSDAAWRGFATSTIFADFSVREVMTLSAIYHSQENVERRAEAFVAAISAPRGDRESEEYQRDSAASITLFLNDLIPAEQGLLLQYDEALRRLQHSSH